MIRFMGTGKAGRFIGFGISQENVNLLRMGKPIYVKKESMNIDYDIVIFYGKDENELKELCQPFINDETDIIDLTNEE